jgi:hypothetical protein
MTLPERFERGSLQHRAYEAVMAPRRQAYAEISRLNAMYERNRENQPLSRYHYIHTNAQIPESMRPVFEDVYEQLRQRKKQKKKMPLQNVPPKQPPKKPPRPPPPPPSFMGHVFA